MLDLRDGTVHTVHTDHYTDEIYDAVFLHGWLNTKLLRLASDDNLALLHSKASLAEPTTDGSLPSPRLKLVKIGARVVRHAGAITFQLAEVALWGPNPRLT